MERQNGLAAMLGIKGSVIHELLGDDKLYPTGGLGRVTPIIAPRLFYNPLDLMELTDTRRCEVMESNEFVMNQRFTSQNLLKLMIC